MNKTRKKIIKKSKKRKRRRKEKKYYSILYFCFRKEKKNPYSIFVENISLF